MKIDFKIITFFILALFMGIFFGRYWAMADIGFYHHRMMVGSGDKLSESKGYLISLKDQMVGEMVGDEHYKCCLEKPCTYCLLEEDKEEGESVGCECLVDVMNGEHPCGECIGEILEGNGNRFIAKYFATAIADELGESHLSEIQNIIREKYGVPVSEQI